MSGLSWLVDSHRFATKIKSASGTYDPERIGWKSNPTKACPNCQHIVDNTDVTHQWPGLPKGVKFDPTDQEIIWHLLANARVENLKPHPFIDEFIPTVDEDDGICYTHPQNLPGVKQDGSVSHFFHRAIKAYNTGTRKRRKIHGDDCGDVRWHKTGRTKPVILDGVQKGCKKIMVLYMSQVRGAKAEKTNWVMHQYHLGTGEDEKDGDYVISKVFYQQQQVKHTEKNEDLLSEGINDAISLKVDLPSPKSATPETLHPERQVLDNVEEKDLVVTSISSPAKHGETECLEDKIHAASENPYDGDHLVAENDAYQMEADNENQAGQDIDGWDSGSQYLLDSQQLVEAMTLCDEILGNRSPNRTVVGSRELENNPNRIVVGGPELEGTPDNNEVGSQELEGKPCHSDNENNAGEDTIGWESGSQYLLNSQQLVEEMTLCDEFLRSQSPNRDGAGKTDIGGKPCLADYAHLGPDNFKRDLEECQALALDPANIETDTPPDFRLSQLEFGSQDSFIAWGGTK